MANGVRLAGTSGFRKRYNQSPDALAQGMPSVAWQDICASHQCRAGILPARLYAIRKMMNCVLDPKELSTWREHLEGVLNVVSFFTRQH